MQISTGQMQKLLFHRTCKLYSISHKYITADNQTDSNQEKQSIKDTQEINLAQTNYTHTQSQKTKLSVHYSTVWKIQILYPFTLVMPKKLWYLSSFSYFTDGWRCRVSAETLSWLCCCWRFATRHCPRTGNLVFIALLWFDVVSTCISYFGANYWQNVAALTKQKIYDVCVFPCAGYAGIVSVWPRVDCDSCAYGITEWWRRRLLWHVVTVNCRVSQWHLITPSVGL